ncbi:MAG TPA: MBL fold metallo-hydrolase [Myxococcaceae bacterium]|nr:MBL fold metallo-hydrolase [Myxococcaceae bacterium]
MDLYVRGLAVGPMKNFVYLLGAVDAAEAAVVDPAWDLDAILSAAHEDGRVVTCAIATHGHNDHINAAPELVARLKVPVYAQRAEIEVTPNLERLGSALRPLEPGSRISVGSLQIRALHSPGHTPGAQCLVCGGAVFTGDTLFVNGCGRCNFPQSDVHQMYRTLTERLGVLPNETRVFPGHDYGDIPVSTLGRERAQNPYLRFPDEASFVAYRMRPPP